MNIGRDLALVQMLLDEMSWSLVAERETLRQKLSEIELTLKMKRQKDLLEGNAVGGTFKHPA